MKTYITLGRNGDLLNTLQIAYLDHCAGHEVGIVTTPEFALMLEGCSWVTPFLYEGHYGDVAGAKRQYPEAQVAQWYGSGEPMVEESFQIEPWRMTGNREFFGHGKLAFDRRDTFREVVLTTNVLNPLSPSDCLKEYVLVAPNGLSSPLQNKLVPDLRERFPSNPVIDLSTVKAERPYDLLGLFDHAACLVTVDTMHLHLARASKVPVVSILNDGWRGSVPPPNSVAEIRYSQFSEERVAAEVARLLSPVGRKILVVDAFGAGPRQERARETWKQFDVVLAGTQWSRDASNIGNDRPLPYLKALLERGLSVAQTGDILVWTNNDVEIKDIQPIAEHAHRFGAVSIRRDEGMDQTHIGRELFAFSVSWLRDRLHRMPDVILAVPWFDLVLARWIRGEMGMATSGAPWERSNLLEDLFPAELPKGAAFHEPHPSSWNTPEILRSPAAMHNQRLWERGV